METIYSKAVEAVDAGDTFRVDFKNRCLTLNHRKVDLLSAPPGIEEPTDLDEWLDRVEDLYDEYKYSRPTSSSDRKSARSYFKALSVEELGKECGHDCLGNPKSRDVAQIELELYILLSLVHGWFNPDELFTKDWFFQGTDKQLIICKNWF